MTGRPVDPDWEALVKVTNANPEIERGKINAALKGIRAAWKSEGGLEEDLPREIELRAAAYLEMWPTLTITPMALSRHWFRVIAQRKRTTPQQQAIEDLRRES